MNPTSRMLQALNIARIRAAEACYYDIRAAKILERLNGLINEIMEPEEMMGDRIHGHDE